MIAGLAFQIFSLIVFMGLWMDFTLRVRRARSADARAEGEEALELADVRGSFKFKAFKAGKYLRVVLVYFLTTLKDSGLPRYASSFDPSTVLWNSMLDSAARLRTTNLRLWFSKVHLSL